MLRSRVSERGGIPFNLGRAGGRERARENAASGTPCLRSGRFFSAESSCLPAISLNRSNRAEQKVSEYAGRQ